MIDERENYKRALLSICFAQKKVIVQITLLITACAVLIYLFWPSTYSANGSILVRGQKFARAPEALEQQQALIRALPITKEDLFSEVQILLSPTVIRKTIESLQATNLLKNKNLADTDLVNLVYYFQSKLDVEVIPASKVIKVTFESRDRPLAVHLVQKLMEEYINYRHEIFSPSQEQGFFSRNAQKFRDSLDAKEKELMNLIEKTKMPNPEREIESNVLLKKELEQQLMQFKIEAVEKKMQIQHLEIALQSQNIQYFSYIENRIINDIASKIMEIYVERDNLLRVYNPESERIKTLDDSLAHKVSMLKAEVTSFKENFQEQMLIAQEKIITIQKRLQKIEDRNVELQKQFVSSKRLTKELELLQYSYEIFLKRQQESEVDNSIDASDLSLYVNILSRAMASDNPVFPTIMIIPLGVLIGFITGISIGFLLEYFDHTFKRPSDVHQNTNITVLFSVPVIDFKQNF